MMVSSSVEGFMGLARKASTMEWCSLLGMFQDESSTIFGGDLKSRMASATSSPVIPGIIQSSRTRSKTGPERMISSASSPLSASVTI